MRQIRPFLVAALLLSLTSTIEAQTVVPVDRFRKVIISPYIQASFVEANEESVSINGINVDSNKLHIEVNHGTLRVYLDGAKEIPHYQQGQAHLYPNHTVVVTVKYRRLDDLSLRGEEKYLCESPLNAPTFSLWVYGQSTVILTEVHINKMHTRLYGESTVDIRSGEVKKQYYTSYGEGKVYATAIAGRRAKVTTFGESEFKVNVSDRIKVTSFGEARLAYLGNPAIVKGIHFGEMHIEKLD